MKSIPSKIVLGLSLLVASLQPTPVSAEPGKQTNQGHHQSGIIGRVMVGQIGFRTAWKVRVSTADHQPITVLQSDADGYFAVNLKPGTYWLTPFLGDEGGAMLIGPSIPVTVKKKDFAVVELPLVFGPYWP